MPWVTPTTVSTGDVLTASRYNADVQGNLTELAPFFSAWTSWTPAMTQTGTLTFTTTSARYLRIGRFVVANFNLTGFSGGTNGAQITMTYGALPTPATRVCVFGSFRWFDAGNTNYAGTIIGDQAGMAFHQDGNGNPLGGGALASAGDVFQGFFVYETAS